MSKNQIDITESFLPPLEEMLPSLKQMWSTKQLSNAGPFHKRFESALAEYLGVKHIALCVNGSFALLAALDALDLSGEVITTPFSFVASAHALRWKGLKPVFADIDPHTLTLDPVRVEAAITPDTTAILAVHLYGHSCDVNALRDIAERYGLKLIFDAAHAFAIKDAGGSILRHGDISVLSFHASKVFTTFEGGAVVCHTPDIYRRIECFRNFCISDDVSVSGVGFNGKMNEFQAALGILQLEYVDGVIERRKLVDSIYRKNLATVPGVRFIEQQPDIRKNYGFLPVIIDEEGPVSRDEVYLQLRAEGIMVRRYFYPLISNLAPYLGLPSASESNLPIANMVANKILCLPIHTGLTSETVEFISNRIGEMLRDE